MEAVIRELSPGETESFIFSLLQLRRSGPSPDHGQKGVHVDIAATDDRCGGPSPAARLAGQHRGHAHGSSALRDQAFLTKEVTHAGGDLLLAYKHDLVDQVAHQGEGEAVVEANAAPQAVGETLLFRYLHGPACLKAVIHGGAALHRSADHADCWQRALHGKRDAGDEAAA